MINLSTQELADMYVNMFNMDPLIGLIDEKTIRDIMIMSINAGKITTYPEDLVSNDELFSWSDVMEENNG